MSYGPAFLQYFLTERYLKIHIGLLKELAANLNRRHCKIVSCFVLFSLLSKDTLIKNCNVVEKGIFLNYILLDVHNFNGFFGALFLPTVALALCYTAHILVYIVLCLYY